MQKVTTNWKLKCSQSH